MSTVDTVKLLLADHVELPADDEAPLELESLILVMVAEELESRFGLRVGARDLVPENFGSVARIARFVESRKC